MTTMLTKEDMKIYLQVNQFRPHSLGNIHRYGINTFNCQQSIIKFNDELWMCMYMTNDNNAVYTNIEGNEYVLVGYGPEGLITRMEEY